MSSISLDNAWLLLIALPLVVLTVIPFAIAVRRDNRNGHNVASCVLHILLAIIVAFAAAGVTIETTLTETNVYVLADVSYSANRNLDLVDQYIGALEKNLPNNSKMGVICFGKDSTVLTQLGDEFTSVKQAEVDDSQTDIVNALQFVRKIFKTNVIKRVVLITDAMQTGANGDDQLKQAVDELLEEGILIDAIYLNDNITADDPEVQLSGVDCNATSYKGHASTATLSVQSTRQTSVTVNLYQTSSAGAEILESRKVNLGAGTNEISFTLSADRAAGNYSYRAEVIAADDFNAYNNECSFSQEVVGEVKVLFITGVYEEKDESAKMLFSGSDVSLDIYYYDPTSVYSDKGSPSVPYTVAELCAYDIIVLSNIDISRLDNYSMFVDSLDVVVSVLGKSVIAIGDLGLQNNSDDAALTKLANILPVNYGNTLRDEKYYIMVLDISHSMAISGRLTHLKEAAKAVINLLNEEDHLVIYRVYGETSMVYDAKMGDGSEPRKVIDELTTLQGTVFSGLKAAMEKSEAFSKSSATSLLLITDGLNSTGDTQDTYTAVQELAEMGVGTSVIDVGLNSDRVQSQQLLDNIAAYGGGTHYYYSYNESLSDDILPSISTEVGESVVEGTVSSVSVSYKYYNDAVLDGLKDNKYIQSSSNYNLSYVKGYVVSSAKSSAATVLTVSYVKNTKTTAAPLYSYWGYGNGRAASFTSSISGSWLGEGQWNVESGKLLQTFFSDVYTTNIPDERLDTPYAVTLNKGTDSYTVEIAPVEVKAGASVTVTVVSVTQNAEGEEVESDPQTLSLVFDSTAYTGTFRVDKTGAYKITVEYEYNGTQYNSYECTAYVSYLTEYDSFALFDASLLYKTIGASGTVSEDGTLTIVNDDSVVQKQTVSLTIPILIAAAVLFVIEIIIRKLKWNDIVSLFGRVNKGGKK